MTLSTSHKDIQARGRREHLSPFANLTLLHMSYEPPCLVEPHINKSWILLKRRSKQFFFFLQVSQLTKNAGNTLSKIIPKIWAVRCSRQVYKITTSRRQHWMFCSVLSIKVLFPPISVFLLKRHHTFHTWHLPRIFHSYNFSSLRTAWKILGKR